MSADVIELRPFQSVRRETQRLGTNMTMALVRAVRKEQREGRSGSAIAGAVFAQRMQRTAPDGPEAA